MSSQAYPSSTACTGHWKGTAGALCIHRRTAVAAGGSSPDSLSHTGLRELASSRTGRRVDFLALLENATPVLPVLVGVSSHDIDVESLDRKDVESRA